MNKAVIVLAAFFGFTSVAALAGPVLPLPSGNVQVVFSNIKSIEANPNNIIIYGTVASAPGFTVGTDVFLNLKASIFPSHCISSAQTLAGTQRIARLLNPGQSTDFLAVSVMGSGTASGSIDSVNSVIAINSFATTQKLHCQSRFVE